MSTLANMVSRVKEELQKGSSLDSIIPDYIEEAAMWLEQNYNFRHMEKYEETNLTSGTRTIGQPPRIKAFKFLRYATTAGKWVDLPQVDAEDVEENESANPTGFWLDGRDYIWFDNSPTSTLTIELVYLQYTEWPTGDNDTNFLLDIGRNALRNQTLYMISAQRTREPEEAVMYKRMRDEALKALQDADQAMIDMARDERMIY